MSPTAWETWTYDADDEAGRTHPTSSLEVVGHWDTPSSMVVDAYARVVLTVRRGLDADVVTTTAYDIDGNVAAVRDALGRLAGRSINDALGRTWSQWLLDSGTMRVAHDPLGGVVERRDDKGAVVLTSFDRAHRFDRVWASDRGGQRPTLRQITVFGDDADGSGLLAQDAAVANVRGRPVVVLDEAGRVATARYDLGGRPVSTARRVLRPDVLLAVLPSAGGDWAGTGYTVDWSPGAGETLTSHAETLLDPTEYRTDARFDALGRATRTTAPLDATGVRSVMTFAYTRGGGLTKATLDGVEHLSQVVHDAHGRRVLALLGNGVLVRYKYDPATQRLRRMRAEHAVATTGGWACDGPVLQDVSHRYDPSGNLLTLGDRTPGCGIPPGDPDALDRRFDYDALGRLISADGRESDVAPADPWIDVPRSNDVTRARRYVETYAYDLAGNLLTLRHTAHGAAGGYTRRFDPGEGNRVATMSIGTTTIPYSYDPRGNTTSEAANRFFEWDHTDRLLVVRDQAGAQPSVYAQYRYDAAGQRVLKVVRRMSGPDVVTVYVGGFERVLRGSVAAPKSSHDEIRLTDQGAALATVRRGDPLPDDPMASHRVRYQLGDHLGSVTRTLGDDSAVLNREEYLPYGETSFGSYASKRYRFTAKERDEESGLAYHGARYCAPWLSRWMSTDPSPRRDGTHAYAYAGNNPLGLVDPDGRAEAPPRTTAAPETSNVPAPRGGNIQVNARVGAEGAAKQGQLLESKGMTIHGREVPVPGGRLDSVTSRAGQGLRSLEHKTMTMFKKGGYYRTDEGELIVARLEARLQKMVDGSRNHVEGMLARKAAHPELAFPTSENILITVRAPKAVVDQVRQVAQGLATRMEGVRIGIGVVGERALSRLEPTASRVANKAAGAVRSIAPSLALGFIVGSLEADYGREFAMHDRTLVPSAEDAAFMQSRGFAYDEATHEWAVHASVWQRIERVVDGLTIWIGDPVWVYEQAQRPRGFSDGCL